MKHLKEIHFVRGGVPAALAKASFISGLRPHGSNHSCGVMVLVRSDLDFNLISINSDDVGRSIVVEAEVQGSPFLFVNIYAPNKTQDQYCFFDKLNNNIEDWVANKELKVAQNSFQHIPKLRF